jgi:hypothetical protein
VSTQYRKEAPVVKKVRLDMYILPLQQEALRQIAERDGVSVAHLIREGINLIIDRKLGGQTRHNGV